MAPRAAYVHVPFCIHRCGYCDFTVIAGRDDLFTGYLSALEQELIHSGSPHEVDTLFVGGGTPTYFPPRELTCFLEMLARHLPLSAGGEFSIEANPSGFDSLRGDLLAEAGINRISLGVQSTHLRHLQTLERDHTLEDITRAVEIARPRVRNVSLDLIYGIPGQTVAEWRETLEQSLALKPTHLSTYGLTYEKGTAFWVRRRKGQLTPVDETVELAMYRSAIERLPAAGFEHYELSNYALPGYRCRHNEVYWQADEYLGFGPGAAAFVKGIRFQNHRSTTTWIKKILAGESAIMSREKLTPEEQAREAIMLGLRQRDGILLDDFARRFGYRIEDLQPDKLQQHVDAGRLEIVAGALRLTDHGCCLADSVMADFL